MPADPGNLVKLLDALEDRALIVRRPGPDDRRRNRLELTGAGARLLRRATAATDRAEREVLTPLTPEQRASLEALARDLWSTQHATPASDLN